MIGAIAGDVIGSVYEHYPVKTKDFALVEPRSRFTDDTVLTVAVADAILNGKPYGDSIWEWGRRYPDAGYGASFINWLRSANPEPYNSWGNGAAMRVSPVGFAFDTADKVLDEAKKTAVVSHNHPEGVKGAQAVAVAVYMARSGRTKPEIQKELSDLFGYDLNPRLDDIRPHYGFDVSSQGSIPEAIVCFLESSSYEDAVRNAVSLGGDSDTQACMAGAVAQAFYGGVPQDIALAAKSRLSDELRAVTDAFMRRFCA